MTIDDELQRRFDVAGQGIDLEGGSVNAVKDLANRRTRRSRVVMSAAAVLMLVALGPILYRILEGSDNGVTETSPDSGVAEQPDATSDNDGSTNETVDDRLTEENLTYVGAFALPSGDVGNSAFDFGGEASAFNPFGDPDSTDGYDGSLFMSGHPVRNLGVAEIAIPAPAPHAGTSEGLPVAEVLSTFADVTDGRGDALVGSEAAGGDGQYRYGGLEVVDGPDGPRLHWAVFQSNNVSDNDPPTHGHSSLDLANPEPQGPWRLGDFNSEITPGYIFTVPQLFADVALGGDRLVTGFKQSQTSNRQSFGPPFISYTPPELDDPAEPAEPGDSIDAQALALYPEIDVAMDDSAFLDLANGATWVAASGEKPVAIVTVGRHSLGELTNGVPGEDDCGISAGSHSGPYEPEILFYDPTDLARVAAGELEPTQVKPYRVWNPAEFLIPTCEWDLSSVSFDADAGRLYVVQLDADTTQSEFGVLPVVHVFEV